MNNLKSDSALVVFSGGQDSTTCLYWALSKFKLVRALTFDYGQRHRIELDAAAKIASLAGVEQEVLKMDLFSRLGGNSLTDELDVKPAEEGALPNSFVPGRNLLFTVTAAAVAYKYGIKNVVLGVCETDYSGYPDCRDDTIKALQVAINLGMAEQFVLHTPLMWMSKADSVVLAKEVGALEALAHSHTCYNGKRPACGLCPSCILRAKGFQEAGIPDPAL